MTKYKLYSEAVYEQVHILSFPGGRERREKLEQLMCNEKETGFQCYNLCRTNTNASINANTNTSIMIRISKF